MSRYRRFRVILSYPAVFFHPEASNLPVYGPPKRWILPETLVLLAPSDAVLCREGLLGGNPDGSILTEIIVPIMQTLSF